MQASADSQISVSVSDLIAWAGAGGTLSLRNSLIRAQRRDTRQSRFKGRGMEYDESRLYQPGDDVRYLDWRVTARTGKTHTKLFCEEREMPVFFCVDFCPSMFFATQGHFKSALAAHITALLAWSAVHSGDRVGGLVFSDATHEEIEPARGKRGISRLFHKLEEFSRRKFSYAAVERTSENTDLAFTRLLKVARPGSMLFVISDFCALSEKAESQLKRLAAHNQVILICLYDRLERQLPPPATYRLSDDNKVFSVNTRRHAFREQHHDHFKQRIKNLQAFSRQIHAGFLKCQTCENPLSFLSVYFPARGAA